MVGDNIRFLRKAKGLTQNQFGELVGKPGHTICKIELGKRRLLGEEVKVFAKALNVNADDLFSENTSMFKDT